MAKWQQVLLAPGFVSHLLAWQTTRDSESKGLISNRMRFLLRHIRIDLGRIEQPSRSLPWSRILVAIDHLVLQ